MRGQLLRTNSRLEKVDVRCNGIGKAGALIRVISCLSRAIVPLFGRVLRQQEEALWVRRVDAHSFPFIRRHCIRRHPAVRHGRAKPCPPLDTVRQLDS